MATSRSTVHQNISLLNPYTSPNLIYPCRSGSLALGKPLTLPNLLLEGSKFLKWTDQVLLVKTNLTSLCLLINYSQSNTLMSPFQENASVPVTALVEKNGFFLYYFEQNSPDVTSIDLCQVRK